MIHFAFPNVGENSPQNQRNHLAILDAQQYEFIGCGRYIASEKDLEKEGGYTSPISVIINRDVVERAAADYKNRSTKRIFEKKLSPLSAKLLIMMIGGKKSLT